MVLLTLLPIYIALVLWLLIPRTPINVRDTVKELVDNGRPADALYTLELGLVRIPWDDEGPLFSLAIQRNIELLAFAERLFTDENVAKGLHAAQLRLQGLRQDYPSLDRTNHEMLIRRGAAVLAEMNDIARELRHLAREMRKQPSRPNPH